MKDESALPTGTFKARGAAVGVSRAKELGVDAVALPTNGNAGAAWAAYSARAGIQSLVVMPEDAPAITRTECAVSGADLRVVEGVISDAGEVVAREVAEGSWFDAGTFHEPYRLEGKKTMGFEICEQLEWRMPDVIICPTGGGVGLVGIYKAFEELLALGWIEGPMPRFVAVQSAGCAPLVKAWRARKDRAEFWRGAWTLAYGINVPKPFADALILEILYATAGCAISVEDEDIRDDIYKIGRQEGCFVCPEGAATLTAARELRDSGWIKEDELVVLLNTGAGLKYPTAVESFTPSHS